MKRMTIGRHGLVFTACFLLVSTLVAGADKTGGNWPGFRGPSASGVADGHALPVEWDVASGSNVKWKTPIPGLAHSSPVIWGERIFITSAVSADPDPFLRVGLYGESPDHPENVEHDFRVYCLDKNTGKIIWEKSAHKGIPKAKRHIKATQANCTPATDGKHVLAFFASVVIRGIRLRILWSSTRSDTRPVLEVRSFPTRACENPPEYAQRAEGHRSRSTSFGTSPAGPSRLPSRPGLPRTCAAGLPHVRSCLPRHPIR